MIAGDTISRYKILSRLGQGGGGVVYRAEDTLLHRPVALKFLAADTLTEGDKQRLLNEARAAAQVRHPNICAVYDVEDVDGQLFIAMACLDGDPLSRKISQGPLGIEAAIDIAIQIATGLERAHEVGIVHRDIKSSNVVVGPDGHVSILDFGLALYSGAARVTAAGQAVGTPAYMSPEQAEGKHVDYRTDLWCLGVVLFEMLTGRLPFGCGGGAAMFRAILSEDAPRLASMRAGVPSELQNIVDVALAKQPERRWQSARDFIRQLESVPRRLSAAVGPYAPTQTIATPARTSQSMRGSGKPAWYAVAVLGVAAAAMYPLLNENQPIPQPPQVKQVAVLPFEVIGNSADARITADGLVEVLTTTLSELEQFEGRIVAVPASEIRRRNITSAEEARRVYGVTLAITGSAQMDGDKLLFTVNLVDTAKLRQTAATHFAYDPKEPLLSRNKAVEGMAHLLQLEAPAAAKGQYSLGDSRDPGAYAAYLHGLGFIARYDITGNVDNAIASFQSATRQDPTFALAYARLAQSYWRKAKTENDIKVAALATENAKHAVLLNPKLAAVHAVLGSIYAASGHSQEAIEELRKALEIEPRSAEAQRELASVYENLGRTREAEQAYLQSTKMRPTDWYAFLLLASFYRSQERFPEAEAAYKTARGLTPDNEIVHRNLSGFYTDQGRYRESVDVLSRSVREGKNPGAFAALGSALFYLRRFPEATAAAQKAVDLAPKKYYYWGNLGIYAKWTPGSEQRSAQTLRVALELAEKAAGISPTDYGIAADLAEYRARLGDSRGALTEIAKIPKPAAPSLAARVALAYELTGHRSKAIQEIVAGIKTPASLRQIENDPDLAKLWSDPALRKALAERPSGR